MTEMRERKPSIKIMPRFKCDAFDSEAYKNFVKEENVEQFIKILMRRIKYNKFDGVVLECPQLWLMEDQYPSFALMIKKLYETLKKQKKDLITFIYPYSEQIKNVLNLKRFEYLSKYVDYFNIYTYDYVSFQKSE